MKQKLDTDVHAAPTTLEATEDCRRLSHRLAQRSSAIQERGGEDVCITCTEEWGRLKGLRDWQEHCSCCFSEAHANGLSDVGITAKIGVAG
jgi:hypothetical protein